MLARADQIFLRERMLKNMKSLLKPLHRSNILTMFIVISCISFEASFQVKTRRDKIELKADASRDMVLMVFNQDYLLELDLATKILSY